MLQKICETELQEEKQMNKKDDFNNRLNRFKQGKIEICIYFYDGHTEAGFIKHIGIDYIDFDNGNPRKMFIIPKKDIKKICY